MARVKRGTTVRARHNKILALAKGYRGRRKNTIRAAIPAVNRAMQNATIGRKLKKRDFRRLWIIRINAAVRQVDADFKYSSFVNGCVKAGIGVDRKMLSDIAVRNPDVFRDIVSAAKEALSVAA